MKNLDVEGLFWLPSDAEQQIGGSLSFDAKRGVKLRLIGAFQDLPTLSMNLDQPLRMHGIVEHKDLTLDQCIRTNYRLRFPGIATEQYHAPILFLGCRFEENEPLEFRSVYLQLHNLQEWVGMTGISVFKQRDNNADSPLRSNIVHNPIEGPNISFEEGDLEIAFPHSINQSKIGEISVREHCGFRLRFASPTPLSKINHFCRLLQDLITIGVGEPVVPTDISLTHSDISREMPDGRVIYDPINLLIQAYRTNQEFTERTIVAPHMFFTFDSIGGIGGVAKWLSVASKYSTVLDVLLSDSYIQQTYSDVKFANAVIATESLIRIRLKEQDFKLRKELERLSSDLGEIFQMLVGEVTPWSKEIVITRKKNVIHRGLYEFENPRLTLLADSLYFLVVLSLLRECGFPEDVMSNIQKHQSFSRLAERFGSDECHRNLARPSA